MMISTRGRYALRVMLDLAEHIGEGNVTLKDIANRQDLSEKYLESIVLMLVRADCVTSVRGKGGGYQLSRAPADYTVGEILRMTEGDLAPVACLAEDAKPCPRAATCQSVGVWQGFYKLTNEYFDGITLAALLDNAAENSEVL